MTDLTDGDRYWLFEQYKIAVEEYRFQVDLNWRRSQYYFVLNAAILAVAASILGIKDLSRWLGAGVFVLGALTSVFAILASETQKQYYHETVRKKAVLENRLGIGEYAINTTTEMGGRIRRLAKVTSFQYIMLGVIALFNVSGFWVAVFLRS